MDAVLLFGTDTNLEVRDPNDRFVQRRDLVDRDPVPIHVRTVVATSDEPLSEERRVDDPEHKFPLEHKRQRDRAQRTAPGEVESAIDRVKDPSAVLRACVAASLLA